MQQRNLLELRFDERRLWICGDYLSYQEKNSLSIACIGIYKAPKYGYGVSVKRRSHLESLDWQT